PLVDRPIPTISSGGTGPPSEPPSAPSSRRMVDALPEIDAPILVIEGDVALETQLHDSLAEAGLHAVGCTSLSEALVYLDRSEPPSLVLLDLLTKESEGWNVLRALRAKPNMDGVPIVVLTDMDERAISRASQEGADDFVRKTPFAPWLLVARIRNQLRLKRSLEELGRRSRDAELLVDLTQALASSLDLREILFTVVVRIAEVVHVDRASIVLVRENDDRAFVVVTSDDREMRDRPIDLTLYPEIQKALADKQPLVIDDAATHPVLEPVRTGSNPPVKLFASLAIVPLLFEGRAMGVLFLRSRTKATFDDRALSLCKTLANATAVGLRNARILQSLRDQTQQITFARYEAERRLRAMQRYADFFESIDDGVCVMDEEGHLLFANPRAKELTGYNEADLKGMKLKELIAEEDRPIGLDIRAKLLRKIYPRGVDLRIRRKDGAIRIFSMTYSSVMHEEGAVLLTLRDVTVERERAIELAQTKDFLEHLIDSSVDAIVSADMRGRIVLFNRAAERIYGMPAAAVLGTGVERLYPKGMAKQIMALIRSDLHGGKGKLEGFRTEFVTAAGELVPITLSAATIQRDDKPIGTVGIFTDLRERLRIEQRLAHAQEQLRLQEKQTIVAELAGAAAHELNQPLTSVMGYAELLRRRLDAGTPQHHAADIIVSEAERMAEIVRKIGKITRYETKTYVGTARILDLDRASGQHEAVTPSGTPGSSGPPGSGRTP
ncbi:MAG: PAS domain S-box protein, partial [Polyangiales bacterium]